MTTKNKNKLVDDLYFFSRGISLESLNCAAKLEKFHVVLSRKMKSES